VTTTAERLAPLELSHFWFAGRDQLVANLLDRFRAPAPVLDLGCGTGAFAARLRRQGIPVVAMDKERPTAAGAGVAGDVVGLPFRAGSGGTVLLRDVLEHVDDGPALDECRRVLGPGGLLVALVPAWPALWSCRDERAGHLRRYTRATLAGLLTNHGFDVLELRGYQFALLPVLAGSRVVARRQGPAQLDREERPPAAVNAAFARINRAEAALARVRWLRPPTGSTLAVVARRR